MEPEVLRVIKDPEPHPPRILDEGERKESVDIPTGRGDARPRARPPVLGALEDEPRRADQHLVVTPVDRLGPDLVHVPLRGFRRIRDGKLDVIIEERLRLDGGDRGPGDD